MGGSRVGTYRIVRIAVYNRRENEMIERKDLFEVRNLSKFGGYIATSNGAIEDYSGRTLNFYNKSGERYVMLTDNDGVVFPIMVKFIVYSAFVDARTRIADTEKICHINGRVKDNRSSNLAIA